MINANLEKGCMKVSISGDSETILDELHEIIIQTLKGFHVRNAEILVLKMLVDTAEEFTESIINKNSISKGEEKND